MAAGPDMSAARFHCRGDVGGGGVEVGRVDVHVDEHDTVSLAVVQSPFEDGEFARVGDAVAGGAEGLGQGSQVWAGMRGVVDGMACAGEVVALLAEAVVV